MAKDLGKEDVAESALTPFNTLLRVTDPAKLTRRDLWGLLAVLPSYCEN